MKRPHYVVVGASAAAMGLLARLPRLAPSALITCIAAQHELPYNTCLLADYLAGLKAGDEIITRNSDFFVTHKIDFRLGTTMTKLNHETHTITVSGPKREVSNVAYDKLFLGLGTRVVRPPIAGLAASERVYNFHTRADTEGLLRRIALHKPQHVTIIGAGLSGVECADALSARGISVSLVEQQDRLMPTLLDDEGSHFLQTYLTNAGIQVHLGMSVVRVAERECEIELTLSGGNLIVTDLLITTTGGVPATNLLNETGMAMHQGRVLVDDYQETNLKDVFAGGDMCMVRDQVTGALVPSSLWTDAMMQGMHAAQTMTGVRKPYPGVCIITASRFFDTMFASTGPVATYDHSYKPVVDATDDYYHLFLRKDGMLAGFLMLGRLRSVGRLRQFLCSRQQVSAKELYELE